MKALLLFAVIQNHIKTSRKRDNELMQMFVCVTTSLGSSGNVIKIINAFNLKRYVSPTLDEGEVTSLIRDFGKVDNPAVAKTHGSTSSTVVLLLKR